MIGRLEPIPTVCEMHRVHNAVSKVSASSARTDNPNIYAFLGRKRGSCRRREGDQLCSSLHGSKNLNAGRVRGIPSHWQCYCHQHQEVERLTAQNLVILSLPVKLWRVSWRRFPSRSAIFGLVYLISGHPIQRANLDFHWD